MTAIAMMLWFWLGMKQARVTVLSSCLDVCEDEIVSLVGMHYFVDLGKLLMMVNEGVVDLPSKIVGKSRVMANDVAMMEMDD
jgi:hypothetical protein